MRTEDLLGRRLGRYEVTSLLGRGGMAAVYRALDTALRREIALKVLYPHYLGDESQIERFKREAVVAAGLDHPNIVQIYDVGEEQGRIYIAMQLLPGRALSDLLRERGRVSPAELVPIVDQIASALDFAHARGIIHRDIKPANILLDADGRAMLTDFGIAKLLDTPGLTSASVMIGTPDYMAPEQIGAQPVDGRVDIYALGVLIFRALTGRRPFEGGTDEVLLGHLHGTVPDASLVEPSLPPALDGVIHTAMARRPQDRYQTANALAAEFRSAIGLAPTVEQRRYIAAAPQPVPYNTPATLAADAPTVRGAVYPAATLPDQPSQQTTYPSRTATRTATPPPYEAPRRSAFWPIVIALLLVIAGGGGFLAARAMSTSDGNAGGGAVIVPTDKPTVQPTQAPTEAPTEAPTAEATIAPTAAPIEATAAPTEAPTVQPTQAPTAAPTTTPTATTRATTAATQTPQPTATATTAATARPTTTPTVAPPSPTPITLIGGFKALYDAEETVRTRLGAPLEAEQRFEGAEQPFELGSMFWTGDEDDTIYVLLDYVLQDGTWRAFPPGSQIGSDDPPAATPSDGQVVPVSGFGDVWSTHADVQAQVGFGTKAEYNMPAAYQRFEDGIMLYSQEGLGKGPSIYVLYDTSKTYQRFADPNNGRS